LKQVLQKLYLATRCCGSKHELQNFRL